MEHSPSSHSISSDRDAPVNDGPSPSSPNDPTCSTRIPRPSILPRKGILKRSGSAHAASRREYLSPQPHQKHEPSDGDGRSRALFTIPGARRTALRPTASFSEEATSTPVNGSRIPKLSVTWWETNSICGEAPQSSRINKQFSPPPLPEERDRGSDEENDDVESIQSGASSIAGSWWFGRTTRYVPHCERRHLHGDESGHYLTPTQRKNREIAELKQEVKRCQKSIDDKEGHLQQLRGRLGELERIMDQGGYLTENQRLLVKMQTIEEEAQREKRVLIEHYDEKVKRLKAAYDRDSFERETTFQFELDELRSSLEREQQQLQSGRMVEDRDSGLSSSGLGLGASLTTDASTMTDGQPEAVHELQAYQYECMLLRNRVSELEFTMKQYEKDLAAEDSCGNKACVSRERAQTAQLEAYKNECLVWRTKASEMEIALKHQMTGKNAMQLQIQSLEQALRQANERQQQHFGSRLRSSSSLSSLTKCSLDDALRAASSSKDDLTMLNADLSTEPGSEEHKKQVTQMRTKVKQLEKKLQSTKKQLRATVGHLKAPCAKEQCVNERKRLTEENEKMSKELKTLEESDETMGKQLDETKRVAHERAEMMKTSEQVIQNMEQQLTSKRTELEVAQLTLQKLKEENEKMNSEVQELNGQLGNLESIMTDCGIVVSTQTSASTASLRRKSMRGGQQPTQIVYRAREVQTELKWQDQVKMENELKELLEGHAILQAKYDEEKADLEMKLEEISQNLHLKNSLVGTLTNQIQMLNDEYEAARAGFERERMQYSQKLHDLDLIAQRVPFLEHDVATAREEVQMVESNYEKEKGRFERAMEDSLTETMKSQWQSAEYWKAKLEQTVKQAEHYKRKCEQAQQELNDTKMRLNLEKVELEQKLQHLCGDLSDLHTKVFAQRRHEAVQTEIMTEDKAILCYVKCDTRETQISKGDLPDERDEQLKMLQGELLATRRQVEVLQGKLLIGESVYQQLEDTDYQRRQLEDTITEQKEQMENMRADLRVKSEDFAVEKERMVLEEQKRIGELEAAFDQVRLELDSIIKRYEEEKEELQVAIKEQHLELERVSCAKDQLEKDMRQLWKCLEQHASECTDFQKKMDQALAVEFAMEQNNTNDGGEFRVNSEGAASLLAKEGSGDEEKKSLDTIRDELAQIAHRFETLADGNRLEEIIKEPMKEDGKEKCELEVTMKANEEDKQKSENAIYESEQHIRSAEDKCRIVQMELEYVLLELHDTRRELELHKSADAPAGRKTVNGKMARKWRSQSDVAIVETKSHQSAVTRDYFNLQQKCAILQKERDHLQRELDTLQIDKSILERDQADSKDDALKISKEKIESGELGELKHQLQQAEHCASRLESEATQWRNEVAFWKGGKKGNAPGSRGSASSIAVDASNQGDKDTDRKLEMELAKYKLECADLKNQLSSTVSKHSLVMRRQQEEIHRLRDRHENELKAVQQVLSQLRLATKSRASTNGSDQTTTDLRERLDDTTLALIEKSKELEQLERDVIYLKARLAEVNVKSALGDGRGDNSSADGFSPTSFAAFLENVKVKHEIEMKALRQELEGRLLDEREKRLGSTSGKLAEKGFLDDIELAKVGTVSVKADDSTENASAFREFLATSDLPISQADVLTRLFKEASIQAETARRNALQLEEKVTELEKELKMTNEELHLKSISHAEQFANLSAENADLRARLLEKANSDSILDIDNNNYAKVEAATKAARAMQERVEQLTSELEERERQHQEMYLLMFRKGQEAAKMELSMMDLDAGGSTSSSEWSFEGRAQAGKEEKPATGPDMQLEYERAKRECASKNTEGLSKEEIVLHFLRDAVYYFLVDRDAKDHLQAIMSILKFSERQRQDVLKAKGFS